MTDTVSKAVRSRMMSAVRSKNTKLEMAFRRRLFAMGFRFRLHAKNLPGKPDIVFPKYSAVILIHSCFWHYHGCHLSELPQTRREWWQEKLEGNRRRDRKVKRQLRQMGWRVITIWECSFRKKGIDRERAFDSLAQRASDFLFSDERFLALPRKSS
jgi:DNA mismatch endonuclease (patch repair protein)